MTVATRRLGGILLLAMPTVDLRRRQPSPAPRQRPRLPGQPAAAGPLARRARPRRRSPRPGPGGAPLRRRRDPRPPTEIPGASYDPRRCAPAAGRLLPLGALPRGDGAERPHLARARRGGAPGRRCRDARLRARAAQPRRAGGAGRRAGRSRLTRARVSPRRARTRDRSAPLATPADRTCAPSRGPRGCRGPRPRRRPAGAARPPAPS